MSKTTSNSGCTIGMAGLLTMLFVVLKLTGTIDWSWWWVVSPMLISWALVLIVMGLLFSIMVLAAFLKK